MPLYVKAHKVHCEIFKLCTTTARYNVQLQDYLEGGSFDWRRCRDLSPGSSQFLKSVSEFSRHAALLALWTQSARKLATRLIEEGFL